MGRCSYCEKNFSLTEKRYRMAGMELCFDCMTCTVCGSRAAGEARGLVKGQPFCGQHLEDAKIRLSKPLSEWTDGWLNIRLNFLTRYRQRLAEKMQKALGTSKLQYAAVALSNQPLQASVGVTSAKNLTYQIHRDGIANVEAEIAQIQDVFRKRQAPENPPAPSDNPLQILKMRYAKGEISKEVYEEMLKTLTG